MPTKSTKNGYCSKFKKQVAPEQLCDYFRVKRRGKYKVCCRNCSHFGLSIPKVSSGKTV